MKKFTIISLILILLTSFGCNTNQKGPSHLSEGRKSLLNSGNAIEAVNLLVEAEKKEEDKTEPRALLVIAYSHALASDAAKAQGVEAEYKKQKTERIAALNDAEMNKMIEILSKRSVVQQNGFQALIEKGIDAAVLLVDNIAKGEYPDAHANFTSTLIQMRSNAVDPILDSITDTAVSSSAKTKLIRVIGEIGDKKAVERLKSVDMTNMDAALKMEISTTLYRLGEKRYKTEIIAGLTADEVGVRRAAAKAMANIENVNTNTLITALNDDDSQVVADIAKALSVHKTKNAVEPLVNIFKTEHSVKAKQAVLNTLAVYTEAGGDLRRGLAKRIALLLINKEVSSSDDRVRLVQFLKRRLVKQLKAASMFDGLDVKLYEYSNEEESTPVRTELNELLELIRK